MALAAAVHRAVPPEEALPVAGPLVVGLLVVVVSALPVAGPPAEALPVAGLLAVGLLVVVVSALPVAALPVLIPVARSRREAAGPPTTSPR